MRISSEYYPSTRYISCLLKFLIFRIIYLHTENKFQVNMLGCIDPVDLCSGHTRRRHVGHIMISHLKHRCAFGNPNITFADYLHLSHTILKWDERFRRRVMLPSVPRLLFWRIVKNSDHSNIIKVKDIPS